MQSAAHSTRGAMAAANFDCIARVEESDRAIDLPMLLFPSRLAVIRCVDREGLKDHTAIATMISEGPFIWGAIVYSESALPDPLGLIESFHVDQLDELVARLTELREAFRETG